MALRCVGYDVVLVKEIVAFSGQSRVTDEELIPWMSDHDAVWVHADDNAKRQHRKLLVHPSGADAMGAPVETARHEQSRAASCAELRTSQSSRPIQATTQQAALLGKCPR